ncbi:MAG: (d)CMP kinase [Chryseobacterium sp.]|nr:MAG: (d)CMP kinase [Chryseobacterium sp.]
MRKPNIAIDGYSSTGKSSISKVIAEKLGLIHLDTGALYRGITYYGLQYCNQDGAVDMECLIDKLPEIILEFRKADNELVLFLNGVEISHEIREPRIANEVSKVAKEPAIRQFLLSSQRSMAANGGVIMDGRDIGSVVLPDADYKFFLTAAVEERTSRRLNELLQSGIETTHEEVMQNLMLRDKIDSERAVAPLTQAADAILVDNTHMDKRQTIDYILSFITK